MSTARATARARVRQDKTRILDTGRLVVVSLDKTQNETRQHTTHKPIPISIQDKIRLEKTKQIMARQKTRQDKTKQKIMEDKTKQGKTQDKTKTRLIKHYELDV
jgi:hypothetical protein